MPFDPVAELLARIRKSREWPLKSEARIWQRVLAWRAFLECDRDALQVVADWKDRDRPYRVDGLPETIVDTWADHLFSEDVDVTPGAEADAQLLDELLGDDLTDELRAAERDYVAPEGEGWWRAYVDQDVADAPIIEFHSRASIVPLYVGKRLMAAALVTVLERPELNADEGRQISPNAVYRHFEINAAGVVQHVVFRGTDRKLGTEVPLDEHPETAPLAEELGEDGRWNHGGPMLMGRVINKRGRDPRLGVSEYSTIKDQLLDLNEAATIGAENARLTAKKRAVVDSSVLTPAPTRPNGAPHPDNLTDDGEGGLVPINGRPWFNAGEDLLVVDTVNEELGRDSGGIFKVLEYSFDAEALITYKRDLVETALTRLRITPQWVGVNVGSSDGYAITGTALRLRAIPTTRAGNSKGKQWDREAPRMIRALQFLDALEEALGGFGRPWTGADLLPGFKRGNPMPVDELESATVEATLVGAGVKSVEQSVKDQHPDWSEEAIADEVKLIAASRPAAPAMGLGVPGGFA